ncbi:MAG: 16S rRNA (cytidine1402-2'-O)-methyltransferase [Candidatus Azotimanducaceae bacterium]
MSCLYIVATPIGNLQDITLRAIEILKTVDLIAAEDTRHSRPLLNHFGISTRLISYREHNEAVATAGLIKTLQAGQSVALISDAGTPLISDPGYRLVKTAREAGVQVIPIPGASAVVAALCASGMATDRFSFQGFLPAKRVGRQRHLQALLIETQTLVFYEAPHRINETLEDVASIFGAERVVTLARELTKRFEQIWHGSANEAIAHLQTGYIPTRGEFVLLIAGTDADLASPAQYEALRIMKLLLPEMPPRRAADIASQITGENKKALYAMAVQLRQQV